MVRTVLAVGDRFQVAEERRRRALLDFLAGGSANRDVGRDQADDFGLAIFRREAFEQRVSVLGVADFERAIGLVWTGAVEDEVAARALECDEACEFVGQLARVLVGSRVEEVVAVEQIERGLSHAVSGLRRAATRPRR